MDRTFQRLEQKSNVEKNLFVSKACGSQINIHWGFGFCAIWKNLFWNSTVGGATIKRRTGDNNCKQRFISAWFAVC